MRLCRQAGLLGMAAAVLVAASAGCSATSTVDSQGGAAEICTGPGVSADQITLGFVYPDSGPGSDALSSTRAGVDARLGLANEQGGIHGRRITYDWRDDATSLTQNVQVVTSLVHDESVFGLLTASVTMGDSMAALSADGVPVVGLAAESSWSNYLNMFSFVYADSPEVVAQYVHTSGAVRAGIVITGDAPSTLQLAARYTSALAAVGIASESVPFNPAVDSATQTARRLAASGVNALVGLSSLDDLAAIMQAARTTGMEIAASVALSGYDQRLLAAKGKQLAGVSFPVAFRPFESGGPAIDRYRQAMNAFAPQAGGPDQQLAMFAYIYTDMFLHGLELAGSCPTRQGFINALRGVTDYDAGGLISPVSLRDNMGKPSPCSAIVQINPAGDAFDVVRQRVCADGTSS
ncbi:ABC-type branched-chain amino acid transport system, substrate-binding protein [Parafrankia irregularis]|uniref:ABC-type branched-chain amino acid transport system, substrate-binding protein n=2 Tax=Parafrankia TaxID=2994362 RepID=A0A0S4QZN5_9ACTN|nr:ABC transporter substrate-binding protein [Parafrankia irregularis]MBE3203368.1 ABC transporter substrate-binding protein [Parafrankia sp. CH37]CUU60232.1 ABC-type branched-chain amino acid transport system, substrate-binding protein [Parafrankia irregularis]